MISHVKFNN